jgi:hypothetical protein
MKRETIVTIVLTAFLAVGPLMYAQGDDDQGPPASPAPSDVLGPQLIAWSELQEPKPLSQPMPLSDQTLQLPDQQRAQTANSSKEQSPVPKSPASQDVKDRNVKDRRN